MGRGKVGLERCNPNDVVGERFGIFEVIGYIGEDNCERSNGKIQKRHKYKIRCTLCGEEGTVYRNGLNIKAKQKRCNKCFHHRDISRPYKMADPNDMIGKIVNGYEVVELVDVVPFRSEKTGKKSFKYWYNCKCTDCGKISKHERLVLKWCDSGGTKHRCPHCGIKEQVETMRAKIDYGVIRKSNLATRNEIRHTVEKAEPTNVTTGIRHYSISIQKVERQGYISVYYRHIIQVSVGGKNYKVIDKLLGPDINDDMVALANEMNQVLLSGNDDDFFRWYNINKKRSR